jgi:hypothetical protein
MKAGQNASISIPLRATARQASNGLSEKGRGESRNARENGRFRSLMVEVRLTIEALKKTSA